MNTIHFLTNLLVYSAMFSGLFSITANNIVHSIIYLIITFVVSAMYLIVMGIQFIGISYIIIYVGAIAILFLFVIMLINIKNTDISDTGNKYTQNIPLAISIIFLFMFIFSTIVSYDLKYIPSLSMLLNKTNNFSNYLIENSIVTINSFFSNQEYKYLLGSSDTFIDEINHISALGFNLYNDSIILLLLLSIIFLLAMVAINILSITKNFKEPFEFLNFK